MYDTIDTLKGAKIQYGPMNDRIYLMKLGEANPAEVLPALDALARENSFGKIFAKIPGRHEQAFLADGFKREAMIPGFYQGKDDGVFLGKYLKSGRAILDNEKGLDEVLSIALNKESLSEAAVLDSQFEFRLAAPGDEEAISEVYRQVFASYPFPIHEAAYIRQTMDDNILYFSIWHEGKMIALSSAEMDRENNNVEMTDFATLPDWRGHRVGMFLLNQMEIEMKKQGFITAYTIARAISPGMNITFARLGYNYGGRLINNTQISGGLESMNIWHKTL